MEDNSTGKVAEREKERKLIRGREDKETRDEPELTVK